MEKEQRTRLQKATQDARRLLEEEFRSQLLQTYDIDVEKVRWAEEPGAHLLVEQRLIREKLIAWIEHKEAQINDRKEALLLALREMAFTALNRFVALKLMEARDLVRPCVSGGLESAGFLEFTAVAEGLLADQESSYRLFLETIFEDVSRELRALFDPRDPASLLWPKRVALLELLEILNRPELAELWSEDETLGWVYQYFNGDAERKKMREESAAPRNSRELAVRNQFFTPRYVVEFLTDNTLGRIWYEMRQGNTILKDRCRYLVRRPTEIWLQPGEEAPAQPDREEALSQEELLRQPLHIPHRELKDPREIRMLDPACGSMHFGLYAFDLYLEIYEEAWEIALVSDECTKQSESFSPFVAYAANFANKAAFMREVPRLILQHNIHGVDIDPRATQIAKLSLWLCAHKSWKAQKVEIAARPQVKRSNVVCAEPMPGERRLLGDFVTQNFSDIEQDIVQRLLEIIFERMRLAGEAGPLLKVEEEIRKAIRHTQSRWQKMAVYQHGIFSKVDLEALGYEDNPSDTGLTGIAREFWDDIEHRIYSALERYARQIERKDEFQRRLFSEDAAQGFALVDICSKLYDIALMNPPFGDAAIECRAYLRKAYPDGYIDLYTAFLDRAYNLINANGLIGAITSRTALTLSSFSGWRKSRLLGQSQIDVCADLGFGVLDSAMVETAAFTLEEGRRDKPMVFIDLEKVVDKGTALIKTSPGTGNDVFLSLAKDLLALPNATMAYFLSSELKQDFYKLPSVASFAEVLGGNKTGDDARFIRCAWEISPTDLKAGPNRKWRWISKGGEYSLFYDSIHLVLDWRRNGGYLGEHMYIERPRNGYLWGPKSWTSAHMGIPGVVWSMRSQKGVSFRALPADCALSGKSSIVTTRITTRDLTLLGILNTERIAQLSRCLATFGSYERGAIGSLPVLDEAHDNQIEMLTRNAFSAVQSANSLFELDPGYSQPIAGFGECIRDAINNAKEAIANYVSILSDQLSLINEAYLDRNSAIQAWRTDCVASLASMVSVKTIISELVGCVYGRWDIRFATRHELLSKELNPFDALPSCQPILLQNSQGEPAKQEDMTDSYPIEVPWDGVLVDDPSSSRDIVLHLRNALDVIWGSRDINNSTLVYQEICELLGAADLREWFRRPADFFADHLNRYSKSRRQAPIYWQLSAASGSYSIWLYYHRFTPDIIYRVLRDFVEPRILQAEREQFDLEGQGSLSGDSANRLQTVQSLLIDLRILKTELDLVAPLWNPNLNDGVIINHAILWRITPYTPWQKKCKECWDKLAKGDYDWAHLAFHLWPERVIRSCTTDRSLAIAHGLEERLWQETNNGNWLPRPLTEADLQALIAEHSNPAVKSALERFLAAPPPVAPTRTRASRSTRSTGSSAPRRPRGTAAVVDAEATRQVLLALTAAPTDGLAKAAIADLIGVEANAITAVIKQLKESGQIDQLGERRGARYVLSEQGRAAVASETEGEA